MFSKDSKWTAKRIKFQQKQFCESPERSSSQLLNVCEALAAAEPRGVLPNVWMESNFASDGLQTQTHNDKVMEFIAMTGFYLCRLRSYGLYCQWKQLATEEFKHVIVFCDAHSAWPEKKVLSQPSFYKDCLLAMTGWITIESSSWWWWCWICLQFTR